MKIVKTLSFALLLGSANFASAQEGSRFSPIAEYLGLSEDIVAAAFGDQDPPDIAAIAAALDITPAELEEALAETRKNAPPRPDEMVEEASEGVMEKAAEVAGDAMEKAAEATQ